MVNVRLSFWKCAFLDFRLNIDEKYELGRRHCVIGIVTMLRARHAMNWGSILEKGIYFVFCNTSKPDLGTFTICYSMAVGS